MAAKRRLAARLRRIYRGRIHDETERYRSASALVFAPHQDDESLGCGGTMILKRRAGVDVRLVFMTDGSTSHARFIGSEELKLLRNQEALHAAQVLDLDPKQVRFLDFPDSKLSRHHEAATLQVLELLQQHRPKEVFVPYRGDGTPDHEATYRIVSDAVRRSGLALRVCQYPVWIWNQWPWVPLPLRLRRETIRAVGRTVRLGFGFPLANTFRSGVFIGDVLAQKKRALEQHRSQMTELQTGVDWPTLSGVSGGAFLECFFQDFEVFDCWENDPAHRSSTKEYKEEYL